VQYKYSSLPNRARQLYSLDPVFAASFDALGGMVGAGNQQVGASMAVDALHRMVAHQQHSAIIGFASDGYPIYGPIGYVNGQAKIMRSSYVQRTYLRFAGDLDICNGIFGPTPEYPDGVYHYHMTIQVHAGGEITRDMYGKNQGGLCPAFPFIVGRFHGVPQGLGINAGPATDEERRNTEEEMKSQQFKMNQAMRVAEEASTRYKSEREQLQEWSRNSGLAVTTPLRLRPY